MICWWCCIRFTAAATRDRETHSETMAVFIAAESRTRVRQQGQPSGSPLNFALQRGRAVRFTGLGDHDCRQEAGVGRNEMVVGLE
jgi:hypothetical protein